MDAVLIALTISWCFGVGAWAWQKVQCAKVKPEEIRANAELQRALNQGDVTQETACIPVGDLTQ